MKKLLFGFVFLLSFNAINAQLSPIELGITGPDSYMKEEMQECAQKYMESLNGILTLKCEHQALGYIIAILESNGFHVISLSWDSCIDAMWVVNYSY